MKTKTNKPARLRKGLGILFLLMALLGSLAWTVLFRINRFSLSVTTVGDSVVEIEYGGRFEEPGVTVSLHGTRFWKTGIPVSGAKLTMEGQVDEAVLGRYTLVYHASWMGLSAQTERKVCIVDTQSPVIRLTEPPDGFWDGRGSFQEPGFSAVDNYDGDITDQVRILHEPGLVTYSVTDRCGNPASVQRKIPVFDREPPVIELTGGQNLTIGVGKPYTEPGFRAEDAVDGDLTAQVLAEGTVDWLRPGMYDITYSVSDAQGNAASVTRQVEVVAQPRPETQWPQEKTIYLTFDDGPGPHTRRLLDVLDRWNVKATFFVTGFGDTELMKQIVERGHSIGIHTVTHDYETIYSSPEAYFDDLYRMQEIIYAATGVRTTLMRFPGGSSNEVSCALSPGIMTTLTQAVQDAGFQYFDWNVDSDDAGRARDAKTVFENVTEGLAQTRAAMVLQHDIHGYSVDAVEQIIAWGLDRGYAFRPLNEHSPGFHHQVNN